MTKQELVAKMQENSAWVDGKKVKIDFDDKGVVMLNGVDKAVTEDDGEILKLTPKKSS